MDFIFYLVFFSRFGPILNPKCKYKLFDDDEEIQINNFIAAFNF